MKKQITFRLKKAGAFLSMIIFSTFAFPQLSDWKNYTNEDLISGILNDGDFLWIATTGGLVKLNKTTLEKTHYNRANVGLPENRLSKVAKDLNNNIWVTTAYCGVGKFNQKNYTQIYTEYNSEIQGNQEYRAITVDKNNNIWIGGSRWLNKFDGTNWQAFTTPSSDIGRWLIYTLKVDKNNNLWIGGTFGEGYLGKFINGEIIAIPEISTPVKSIEIDKNENLWLGTNIGLIKYKEGSSTIYTPKNSALAQENVRDVKADNKNNLWLACSKYLVKFDGQDFINYEVPGISKDNFLYCIEPDNDAIWLGTYRNGLIKYADGDFKAIDISSSSLITNNIGLNAIIDNEGNLWLGTEHNLVKIDKDNRWHSYFEKIDNITGEFRINGVGADLTGDIWIALGRSDTCIVKIEKDKTIAFTRKDIPLFKQFIQSTCNFAFDRKGNTWVGGYGGIYKYDGKEWTLYSPQNTPLPSHVILNLAIDKEDNLWGGMGDEINAGGIFKYDGKEWLIYNSKNSGLPTTIVSNLAFDWISNRDNGNNIEKELGGGITKFDGTTWTTYNRNNSKIPSNSILDIVIDKEDNLWLATYGGVGITKFDGKNWTSYNMGNSGIAYNEVSKITLDYGRDLIWLNHMNSHGLSTAKLNWKGGNIETTPFNEKEKAFTISPNPATLTKSISLHFNKATQITGIEICTTSGQLIGAIKLNKVLAAEYSLSLPELNIQQNEIYIIKVITDEGIYTNKIWVNK